MEVFIGGLPQSIEGTVTASKPQTLEEATNIAQRLMDHIRKFDDRRNTTDNNYYNNRNNNNYQNNRNNNNNNHNNDHHQHQNRRQETVRAYAATPTENSRYTGNLPLCKRCTLHHTGPCTVKCQTCNKVGHQTRNCKNKGPTTGSNLQPVSVTCLAWALQKSVPKSKQQCPRKSILAERQERSPRLERSDKSFISISLASMLNIPLITLDTTYEIEMADGNLVGTNTVIQVYTLILLNQPFEIDLMPIKLGSFDVVIGMDWLSKYHARIICDEKVV
ncbi:reverse transcriptase domain-containing protein, partial [Tanacetum coccineum]